MKIVNVSAYKILASLGDETVEAKIVFDNGQATAASVPAGISAGKYEIAKVPADEAVEQIGQMKKMLSGKDWDQAKLDWEIASHGFGGNATLAVSAAFFKAGLTGANPDLRTTNFPKLMVLMFEGGEHGTPSNKALSFQEFLVIEESVAQADADCKRLREYLNREKIETLVGAEGGFSPASFSNDTALATIKQVFPDKKIALDLAASFHQDEPLALESYNIVSVEDPFDDESWDQWVEFSKNHPDLLVVGDDLTTTNPERVKKAVDTKAINAVVIKPNQIGTISGAKEAVRVAREGGLKIVVSHRGQETDDDWIADFALAVNADYVKFGGMDRGERISKYNRLLELGMK